MLMPGRQVYLDTTTTNVGNSSAGGAPPSVDTAAAILYKHSFNDNPSAHPYITAPDVLNSNLSSSSWVNSMLSWTSFAGITGQAIAFMDTRPDTATITLNVNIATGKTVNISSYSFYERGSLGNGYTHWKMYINGIEVGDSSIFTGSGPMESTGTREVSNPVENLSGSISVLLKLYDHLSGGDAQGNFRLDDFVLSGYVNDAVAGSATGVQYAQNGGYRYGFNGKENDDEVKGEGNQQDYGMRIYDPRLGRFLSVDPIGNEYPWNSTYAFAEGDPINFIDLDGLERLPPPRPGGGRGRNGGGIRVTGLRSYAEESANEVGKAARETRTARERLEAMRHLRRINSDPNYANNVRSTNVFLSRVARENYINNAFNAASSVFGGGNVRDNYRAGDKWDDIVHTTMLANPNYIGVARQVSLKVTGTVNGQTVVANIRVDNVGISKDATGKVLFNLVEAKYSINDITINNVKQTLTPQQKMTDYILLNGKDVQFYVRGAGSASVLTQASAAAGTSFVKDQNISGNISEITVVVPGTNSSTSQSNNSTSATTKKPSKPPSQ